jgi:hypothetical protein
MNLTEKKTLTPEEEQEIQKQVETEFPEDPALQLIHIARKRISKLAEHAGLSYLEYVDQINQNS